MKYLGESFDIHGGGLDNQFPHHECEIAQSVCATGKPFVKYWLHNNLVTVNGQKMSKSLGNFVTLKDAFKKYDPLVIRFFILQSHYRSTLDFSDEALAGARGGFEKFLNTVRNLRFELAKAQVESSGRPLPFDLQPFRRRFLEAMDDDFNTPQAIAVIFELTKEVNQLLNTDSRPGVEALQSIDMLFRELGGSILGLVPDGLRNEASTDGKVEAELIQLLIDVRNKVRKEKLFTLSDMIRDGLKRVGIVLEDKKDGTVWKRMT
jgi:cysteinyl-tRNA synthetase